MRNVLSVDMVILLLRFILRNGLKVKRLSFRMYNNCFFRVTGMERVFAFLRNKVIDLFLGYIGCISIFSLCLVTKRHPRGGMQHPIIFSPHTFPKVLCVFFSYLIPGVSSFDIVVGGDVV